MAWENQEYYKIAVYWPESDTYGLPSIVTTEKEIPEAVAKLKNLGFGSWRSEIHVCHVKIELIPF